MRKGSRSHRLIVKVRRFVRTTSEILTELKVLTVEIVVFIAFLYFLLK